MLGYDDSLDAFGVHGVGGIVGALLTGVFAYGPLSATDAKPDGSCRRPGAAHICSAIGVAVTLVWSACHDLHPAEGHRRHDRPAGRTEEEREGLDIVLHGEQIF